MRGQTEQMVSAFHLFQKQVLLCAGQCAGLRVVTKTEGLPVLLSLESGGKINLDN